MTTKSTVKVSFDTNVTKKIPLPSEMPSCVPFVVLNILGQKKVCTRISTVTFLFIDQHGAITWEEESRWVNEEYKVLNESAEVQIIIVKS